MMPRFDRTGPMGMGPMTGGARGWCHPSSRSMGRMDCGPVPRAGRGRGRGRGRGWPGGYGNMFWGQETPGWIGGETGPARELAYLRHEAAALKETIAAIDSRIREIESEQAETRSQR